MKWNPENTKNIEQVQIFLLCVHSICAFIAENSILNLNVKCYLNWRTDDQIEFYFRFRRDRPKQILFKLKCDRPKKMLFEIDRSKEMLFQI